MKKNNLGALCLLMALLMTVMALITVVPVSAEEIVASDGVMVEILEPEAEMLDVLEDSEVTRYQSKETELITEPLELGIEPKRLSAKGPSFGVEKPSYYTQCAYKVKSIYDIIAVYTLAEDGSYPSRMFLIYDYKYPEEGWLRYDYTLDAALEFLGEGNYEAKEVNGRTLYVPVAKTKSGKNVAHKDIEGTPLDETKVPLITVADAEEYTLDWRGIEDVPFVKDGSGNYVYATVESEPTPTPTPTPEPTPTGEPTPTPEPTGEPTPTPEPTPDNMTRVKVTIGGKTVYVIEYTSTVTYNGKAHVWAQKRLSSKALRKKVNDVVVNVYKNDVLLPSGDFNVKFKNNVKVSGTSGKQPFFRLILKGKANKKDRAPMKTVKFKFDIVEASSSEE